MANTSRPFGFRPSRYMSAAAFTGKATLYGFSASDANAAFIGDVVSFDGTYRATGLTDAYASGIPLITPRVAAITTGYVRGIVVGFAPQPEFNQEATASLGTKYRLASTARYAWVVDDPSVVFEAEETGNSWTTAASNAVNKVMDIAWTTGNTSSGIAKVVLDASTLSTSAVKPFRVLRYTQRVDNFNFTASDTNSRAHLDVLMNSSDLPGALTTQVGA